jgi:pyruvate/2-oxoglutarate dehydrogenase complex dihydrolipoamide dehydrogenase (E3) component
MTPDPFDAIIIGAGQAGPAIAARCSKEGLRTAVVERGHFGGTCVNVGCVPTKTLVASARAMRVDMARVMARKDGIVGASRSGVESWMRGLKHTDVIVGEARFVGPATLQVGARQLTAPRIFLNVGCRAVRPDMPGINTVPTLDNVSILQLAHLPEHLAIIGGSYIGLEFAQMMRRFGAQVTVVERSPQLLPREDADVSDGIQSILANEGVHFALGSDCISLAQDGQRITVGTACGDDRPTFSASHVLLAVGRQPNTESLGLAAAGIQTDARGYITVDDQCQTSAPGVWAVGDCNGRGAFTHTAWNDHEIVVANLFDNDPRRITDRAPCYALFIDPPLGRIGMTDTQARATLAQGRNVLHAKMPMQRVGRAREAGETQGFMKVLVDADSKLLLGAAVLGLNGDEVVHGLLDVMLAKQPYTVISRAVHIHPTVSELVPTLLQQLKPLV